MTELEDIAVLTEFDKALLKLRRDVVSRCTFRGINDGSAFLLAGSLLMGNKNLHSLTFHTGMEMTALGARALGKAIRKSKIMELHLHDDDGEGVPSCGVRTLYMEAIKTVRDLCMGFELINKDAQRIGKALRTNKTLQRLSVVLEHVTEPGARVLAEGIQSSRISDLRIQGATPEVVKVLLSRGVESSATIKHLHFSIDSGDDALSKIVPSLHALHIEEFVDVDAGIQLLCDGLRKSTQLMKLEFGSVCPLNDQHMEMLSAAIQGIETLKVLTIVSDSFGEKGVASLVASWENGSHLEELRLHDNNIGVAGMQLLLKASSTHLHLKTLDLNSSHDIGFAGLTKIAMDLHKSKLSMFEVMAGQQEQDATDAASVKARKGARKTASQALVQAMKSNFYLEQFNLSYIDITPAATVEMNFYLKLNRSGRRLLMEEGLQTSIWCHALALWRNDPSQMFYFLREQPTLMSSFKSTTGKRRRPTNAIPAEPAPKRQRAADDFLDEPVVRLSLQAVMFAVLLHAFCTFGQRTVEAE